MLEAAAKKKAAQEKLEAAKQLLIEEDQEAQRLATIAVKFCIGGDSAMSEAVPVPPPEGASVGSVVPAISEEAEKKIALLQTDFEAKDGSDISDSDAEYEKNGHDDDGDVAPATGAKKRGPLTKAKKNGPWTRTNGVYLNPDLWPRSEADDAALAERVVLHWKDVGTFIEDIEEKDAGKFGLLMCDPPWGYIPSLHHDKPWATEFVHKVCRAMHGLCTPNGTVVILCGTDEMVTTWREGLSAAGFYLEKQAKILVTGSTRQWNKHAWQKFGKDGVTLHMSMVVACKCSANSSKRVLHQPYGCFGKDSTGSVTLKVPWMRQLDRLSSKDRVLRFQEKNVQIYLEIIHRYSVCVSACFFFWCVRVFFFLFSSQNTHKTHTNPHTHTHTHTHTQVQQPM